MVRTLGREGLRVAAAASGQHCSGLATRYASTRLHLPDPRQDLPAYADAIVRWLDAHPTDAVLTSTDAGLETLHQYRIPLGEVTRPAVAAPEAVDIAACKATTLAVAAELGIPGPRSIPATTPDEVLEAIAALGLPAVLKPTSSWRDAPDGGGERLSPVLVETPEQARCAAAHLVRADSPALVQEYATGGRETHKLFVAQGAVLVHLVMRPERCWPPLGGSSTMRRTIDPPERTTAWARELVLRIGLEGYSEVEFRRTLAGEPLLMEVNARLSQSLELAQRAGVDLARMQLEWARGGDIPVPQRVRAARVGWLGGDLRVAAGALKGTPPPRPPRAAIRAVGGDYLLGRAHVEGLALDDLRPIVGAVGFHLRNGVAHLRRNHA